MSKMCKNHPGKDAVIRKDGKSTGRCTECLQASAAKARAGKGKA